MTSRTSVDNFIGQRKLAVVGVSRSGKGFGNAALKELEAHGYEMLPVNPAADELGGRRCYRSLADLPKDVGGVLVVVPPAQTAEVVRDAAAAGIHRIWMQQGASSPEAIALCEQLGMEAIAGECILMFAAPHGLHKLHHWIWGAIGKLPS